jgi:hypothetical protein
MTITEAPSQLPERPPISRPGRRHGGAASQPGLGLLGLLLVVPIAGALAVGAGGADASVLVLGPLHVAIGRRWPFATRAPGRTVPAASSVGP